MKLTTDKFTIEWSNEEIEQFIKRFTPYSLNQELRIWNTEPLPEYSLELIK